MAESYFDLLTEQEGMPAKPFDPVEELKRLRRGLMLRLQISKTPEEEIADPLLLQAENTAKEIVTASPSKNVTPETEPVSLESVLHKAGKIKKMLAFWQRSRLRAKTVRKDMFRGIQKPRSEREKTMLVDAYLTASPEGTLETVNAGLMALGIIGVVFGVLCFFRGLESDLSIGSVVCATGAAIVVIGLGGRFLASRFDISW